MMARRCLHDTAELTSSSVTILMKINNNGVLSPGTVIETQAWSRLHTPDVPGHEVLYPGMGIRVCEKITQNVAKPFLVKVNT
jgi:hypothetical protein